MSRRPSRGAAIDRGGGSRDRIVSAGKTVRYAYIGLIVVFTAIVVLFKIQNVEVVTVTLFSASLTLSVSVLVIGVYILGMLSGSFLVSLLRAWIRGAKGVD